MENLENYGVELLDKQGVKEINGGKAWPWYVALAIWIYDNRSDIKEGWDSYEPKYS